MPNLLSVGIAGGVPNFGTGNVSTIDTLYGYNYTNISATGTATIKSGAGFLHCIVINQVGGGSGGTGASSTVVLYDSLSGSGATIATLDTVSSIGTILYDIAFSTGLTLLTSAVGASPNLTISWR